MHGLGGLKEMTLIPGFLRTAGRGLSLKHFNAHSLFGGYSRSFSAAAVLTRDQVDERILGVLRAFDRVNKDRITMNSKFTSDLGLDSLDVVEVMIAVEEEFQMEIPDEVADKCATPKDAAEYVFAQQSSS